MTMNGRRQIRGISIPISLMVLMIIIVIVFAIAAQGSWNLGYVKKDTQREVAYYAAEAGVQELLLRYRHKDTDFKWREGIRKEDGTLVTRTNPKQLPASNGYYYAEVKRSGKLLPNGATVPDGLICFIGTGKFGPFQGTAIDTSKERQVVATMLELYDYNCAVAAAQNIELKNTIIKGSIKASGNIYFISSLNLYPEEIRDPVSGALLAYGDGRILASGIIDNGAKQITIMKSAEPNLIQDVRGRGTSPTLYDGISGQGKVYNADPMVPNTSTGKTNDTSWATLSYINDGGTDKQLDEGTYGDRLPCPNMTTLLSTVTATYRNAGKTVYDCSANGIASLGAGVYYFPDGVILNCQISGDVTIITGKSKGQTITSKLSPTNNVTSTQFIASSAPGHITFNTNIPLDASKKPIYTTNLLALDGGTGSPPWEGNGTMGTATISFSNSADIRGLIYSQGSIVTQGNFNCWGSVISYKGNYTHTGAMSTFTYDRELCMSCPGFHQWFELTPVDFNKHMRSWQRF